MVTIANDASIGQVMNLLKVSKALVLDRGTSKSRDVEIPVLYKGMEGPDMGRVCEKTGFSTAEVIRRHSEPDYLVHFIGFSIGFPYLGGMDVSISTVRLETPRRSVPAGSIGIAGNQTGIYPKSSPGGWNIIGQTPLSIFNAENPVESTVKMGDKVRFRPIDESEFNILAINQ